MNYSRHPDSYQGAYSGFLFNLGIVELNILIMAVSSFLYKISLEFVLNDRCFGSLGRFFFIIYAKKTSISKIRYKREFPFNKVFYHKTF